MLLFGGIGEANFENNLFLNIFVLSIEIFYLHFPSVTYFSLTAKSTICKKLKSVYKVSLFKQALLKFCIFSTNKSSIAMVLLTPGEENKSF